MMQVIFQRDYYLLPLYLALVFIIVFLFRKKANIDKTTNKIYFIAFGVKVIGALSFAFVLQYYYGSGDSMVYFSEASSFHNHIIDKPSNLRFFFASVDQYALLSDLAHTGRTYFVIDSSALVVIKLATFFSLLSFNTYLTTTLFFVLLSFSGLWAIFLIFSKLYPLLKKQLAWGILYLPSLNFWSSGIMKDSITIAALGWLFYSFYMFFILKRRKSVYLVISIISIYLMLVIKYYIIAAISIAFILSGIFTLLLNLRPVALRVGLIVGILISIFILFTTENSEQTFLSSASIDIIVDEIATQQRLYLTNKTVDEGNFDAGSLTPTLSGLLEKIPEAIVAVLYRPFIWESKKFMIFLSGFENFILMILSIIIIIRAGLFNFLKIILTHNLVRFCLFFTIILAIIIGLTTFNFGTILRYKAPCMPFYTSFLILINYYASVSRQKKAHTNTKLLFFNIL